MGFFIRLSCTLLCLATYYHGVQAAVSLSHDDRGQALVVPYYTVANDLNTLVSISNHQDQPKALKIHLKDGRLGANILSFNLYLGAHDNWSFAMAESNNGPMILDSDDSCTIGLVNGGGVEPPLGLSGWDQQVGTIEIIEMGQVLTESNGFFGNLSPDDNCIRLNNAWYAQGPNSFWQAESSAEMAPVSGGITVDVTVIDVGQGIAFKVPTLAFNDFFDAGTIHHRAPEDAEPNLDSGSHDSLLLQQGQAVQTTWPTGYEAISALLTKSSIRSEYSLIDVLAAQTDWVLSFPTWPYHRSNPDTAQPFILNATANAFQISFLYDSTFFLYDELGRVYDFNPRFPIDPAPPIPERYYTAVINTLQLFFDDYNLIQPSISGDFRDNVSTFYLLANNFNDPFSNLELFDAGTVELVFNDRNSIDNDRGSQTDTSVPHTYVGLPVTGFSVMRFINASAQPGLLATYALTKPNHSKRLIITAQEANHE